MCDIALDLVEESYFDHILKAEHKVIDFMNSLKEGYEEPIYSETAPYWTWFENLSDRFPNCIENDAVWQIKYEIQEMRPYIHPDSLLHIFLPMYLDAIEAAGYTEAAYEYLLQETGCEKVVA